MTSPAGETARSLAPRRFALYTSSLGNYFFHEIRDLIGAGLRELGMTVEVRDERTGFAGDADWHIVVGPHEFFELGAGRGLVLQKWPAQLILFNTEQPSTYWLKLSAKHFDRAAAIWDINFESTLRLCKRGYPCSYLPLGDVSASPMFQDVPRLPLHEETRHLSVEIRDRCGFHQPFGLRPIDLLFLGHATQRREQYFARYADRLQKLKCFVHKPAATRPMIPGQTTSMNTLTSVGLAQRSKILLNIHHGVDRYFEWHRIVLLGCAQRALVITEPCTLAPPFQAGCDFVQASLEELPDRIDHYLGSKAGQEQAQRIIDHGFETLKIRCRLSDSLRPLVEQLTVTPSQASAMRYFPVAAPRAAASPPLAICVVTPDVTGEGPQADAGSAQVALAETLALAGHQVTLLHTDPQLGENQSLSHRQEYFAGRGIEYVSLPGDPRVPLDGSEACCRAYEAYLWLRRHSFQVVHLPDTHGIGFYALLARNQGTDFERTRFCLNAHGPRFWRRQVSQELVTNPSELELDFMERECLRLADALTTSTDFMLRWLEAQNWVLPALRQVRPDPISVSPAAIDRSPRPVRELVYFGPLQQSPGLTLFCDALDRVEPAALINVTVKFVGQVVGQVGKQAALYLQQRGRKWSFGWQVAVSGSGVSHFQGDGRLAVLPSARENSPLALRQLLGLGLPFLAAGGGGNGELVDPDDHPFAIFEATPRSLAAALQRTLKEGARVPRPAQANAERLKTWIQCHQDWAGATALAGGANPMPGSTPLVSVCLVHFNRPEYLTQSVASLRAQDYPNFEVVLVDDGSTRPEAIAFLAGLEPEFKQRSWQIVRQDNRYLGAARNTGARHARGEYLIFMDDDNFAKPHEISTFVRVAQRTGAEILTSAMDLFTGTEPPDPAAKPKVRWAFLGGAAATGAIRNCFGDANCCIRRDTFLRVGGFTEDYGITHEDWEFYARAVLQGCRMETMPEALFWYRTAEDSMIRSTDLYANLQRSLRPYLAVVPAPLHGLIHYLQGVTCTPPEVALPVANQENLLRLHQRLVGVGKQMIKAGQSKAAEAVFLEVIQSAESAGHPPLLLQTLLDVGRALVESGQRQIAGQILESAVEIARTAAEPGSLKEAQALLATAKGSAASGTKPASANGSSPRPARAAAAVAPQPVGDPVVPVATIIIPTLNNLSLTRSCLDSIARHPAGATFEIVLVDNASDDGTAEFLREQEQAGRIRLVANRRNEGFARASNQGAQAARGSLLLFLNNDTRVTPGWLNAMVQAAGRPQVGIVGAKLLYADDRIQHAGIGFINGLPDHPHRHASADAPEVNRFLELDMVTGACLLARRELFVQLGGFDEAYRNGVEDVDLCLRARAAGWKVVYEPKAVVYHLEGQSAGRFDQVNENLQFFFGRWRNAFDAAMRFILPRPPKVIAASRSLLLDAPSAPAPDRQPVRVAWEGTFLDLGSLSHVNRELTRQLATRSDIRLARVGGGPIPEGVAAKGLQGVAATLVAKPPADAQITVRHAWPPNWNPPARGPLVIIQPWEYGFLPADWVRESTHVAEFWVPSDYVRRVYVESGVPAEKVHVVPNGVDVDWFHPQATPMKLATSKRFKFLFVGGTIHRKGPDLLLRAYLENFKAGDDVCLVIKDFGGQTVYAGQTFEAQIRLAQARPDAPEILYLNDELAPEALPGLYTACNCLVHPYRGEGFGLPVLEAMAAGLPVIVTAGGSTDDFAIEPFAFRIPAQRRVFGHEVSGMKLAGAGWLLEPDVPALGERMRWMVANPLEAQERGRKGRERASLSWTWAKAAQAAGQRIQYLQERSPSKPGSTRDTAKFAPAKKPAIILPACAKLAQLTEAREFLTQKKFRPAWEAAVAALEKRPFHPEAFLLLGQIAQATGDGQDARLCAEHARRLAPGWKPARQLLNQRLKGGSRPDWLKLPTGLSSDHAPAALKSDEGGSRITDSSRRSQTQADHAPRLSVCLIVKNEERFLAQCLKSVRDLAHQMVVVDTGSTDRTIEIARKHGAEVHTFAWCDDFSAARNEALTHATGDWVLALDADEQLAPHAGDELRQALVDAAVMAWRLPIVNVGRETEGCSYVPRLFRNAPGLFYLGRVHEQVFSSIEVRRAEWGLENRIGQATLLHHGYAAEVLRDRNKVERNLALLERAIEELPNEPHLLMNLGLELARSGREPDALARYQEAFEALSTKPAAEVVPELRETLLTQLCARLAAARKFGEIAEVLTSPLAQWGGGLTASLHFSLGLAQMELGAFREGAEQMRQCLAKRSQPAFSPINADINSAAPHHCLAQCLVRLDAADAAAKAFEAGLKETGHGDTLRLDYARFLNAQGRPVDALHRLNEIVAENSRHTLAWRLGGQIALSQPHFLEFACDWTLEALRNAAEDPEVAAQRAEVLLLSQDAAAGELWERVWSHDPKPQALAALILCDQLQGEPAPAHRPKDDHEEAAVSRAFIDWYRKLLAARAYRTIKRLNERTDGLRPILPGAAKVLQAAIAEADEPASELVTT